MAWTIFSAIVGAGYASGRELVVFFHPCHPLSMPAAIVAGVLAGVVAGWGEPEARPAPPGSSGAGELPGLLERVATVWLSWVSLAAMLAGLGHLFDPAGRHRVLATLAGAGLVWAGAALPAQQGLARIASWLGPPVVVIMTLEALAWRVLGGALATPPGAARPGPACVWNLLSYAAANALFARGAVLPVAQGLGLRLPALRVASVLGGVMVGVVAAAGLAIIARSGTHEAAMPLASASAALHPVALGLHLGVLFAAIYTTGVAAAVSLGSSGRGRANGPMGAVTRQAGWWILSAVPVALAGFAETVARLYPAAGWMALTVLALRAGFASWLRRRLY